jgi:hypothetical protein
LPFLGFVVSSQGISVDHSKIRAVQAFPVPSYVKEVQNFLGLCSYYRHFVKNFAALTHYVLTELTKKSNPFIWGEAQQACFDELKNVFLSPLILGHSNYGLPMEIHCDASGHGIGAVLVQKQDGEERVLSYANRLLSLAERNYPTTEKECLALVQKFENYVWGMKIKVVTDHHSLCWLMKKRDLARRLARWSLQLQDLDIEIVHRSGRLHSDADALSRSPVDPPEEETTTH